MKTPFRSSLTLAERKSIKTIQNKVVKRLLAEGYSLNDKIGLRDNSSKDITVKDLKLYIYPQFKNYFKEALS